MAATRILYYAGPPSCLLKVVQPLLRLLNQSREVERVVLVYIFIISKTNPVKHSSLQMRFELTDDRNPLLPITLDFLFDTMMLGKLKETNSGY